MGLSKFQNYVWHKRRKNYMPGYGSRRKSMAYKAEYVCVSHIGKRRKANQDNFICDSEYLPYVNNGTEEMLLGKVKTADLPVFGIFDGMGGEECGEMAAYLAAKEAAEFQWTGDAEQALHDYCREANRVLCEYIKEQEIGSMGTTAAMVWLYEKEVFCFNIGDSRIYRLSAGKLEQVSKDHVSFSVAGRKPPLTQNLGIPEDELTLAPHIVKEQCRKNDVYLLCSDGLTDMVEEEEIARLLGQEDKKLAAEQLLQSALEQGGRDNISFIILDLKRYFLVL